MKVDASTVATHEFTAVRRRGYDPSEVDAVMTRVADALRTYEEQVAALQEAVEQAKQPSEAIQRMLVAAQATKDEMIAEARQQAEELRAEAFATSHELIESCKTEVSAVETETRERVLALEQEAQQRLAAAEAEADRIVDDAQATADAIEEEAEASLRAARSEADALIEEARTEAGERISRSERAATAAVEMAVAEADGVRSTAEAEAAALRDQADAEATELMVTASAEARRLTDEARTEAEEVTRTAAAETAALLTRSRTEAEDRLASAQSQADRILEHARERASEITSDAREEKDALDHRLAQLRTAVSEIEAELHGLAELALERVAVAESMFALERLEPRAAVGIVSGTAVVTAGNVASWTPVGFPPVDIEPDPAPADVVELTPAEEEAVPGEEDLPVVAEAVAEVIEMVEEAEAGVIDWGVDDLSAAEMYAATHDPSTPVPDGSGLLPEQRVELENVTIDLTGDEPVIEVSRETRNRTIYQRRTGGLRRRLEQALGGEDKPPAGG